MIDIQDEKQRSALKEAANSEEGKLIVRYLKQQYETLDTNAIVRNDRKKEDVEREFWAKSEAREILDETINILTN